MKEPPEMRFCSLCNQPLGRPKEQAWALAQSEVLVPHNFRAGVYGEVEELPQYSVVCFCILITKSTMWSRWQPHALPRVVRVLSRS